MPTMSAPISRNLVDIDKTGAVICTDIMKGHGVDYVFGYPGGAILPLLDEIYLARDIRFILSRHEQGAGHMAEGYARAKGRAGVVLVTSGPGVTNVVTPLYNAFMDQTPLVVIAGQVETALIGTWAFQEVDAISITQTCTKWSARVESIDVLSPLLHHAFALATSGQPGPVLIEIPKDILQANLLPGANETCPWTTLSSLAFADRRPLHTGMQGAVATVRGMPCMKDRAMDRAISLINKSLKPVILAGRGMTASANSRSALMNLARCGQIPVATTLHSMGLIDPDDELSLGMVGVYGSARANCAIQAADVIIVLGARLDDRVTAKLKLFAPAARKAFDEEQGGILRFELERSRLNSPFCAAVGIAGCVGQSIDALVADITGKELRSEWLQLIRTWPRPYPQPGAMTSTDNDQLSTAQVVQALSRILSCRSDDTIITTGVGQHQMSTAHNFRFVRPGTLITSGGAGTMGFGLPAAIGAKLACPNSVVIDIDGDASLIMTASEMLTAVEAGLDVKVIVLNNGSQGMITQLQADYYHNRLAYSRQLNADFVALARAMGLKSNRVAHSRELDGGLCWLLDTDGPALLDVSVRSKHDELPYVRNGRALHEIENLD